MPRNIISTFNLVSTRRKLKYMIFNHILISEKKGWCYTVFSHPGDFETRCNIYVQLDKF